MSNTHRLPPHARRRHWETWNSEALTPLDVFSPSPDGPIVSSHQRVVDSVKFTLLRGASHAVQHDAEHIASKPQDSLFTTIILTGEGFFYSSSLTTSFRADEALIYPVSQPYLIVFTGEMVQITVDIPSTILDGWKIGAERRQPQLMPLTQEMSATAARLPRLLSDADDAQMAAALGLIRGILQNPHELSETARIYSAGEHLIRLNFARPEFDVSALANELSISERQLRRVFEVYGRSPGKSLRDARLEAARQVILSTSRPVKSIATETGFTSGESLIRAYRSRFGTTPSEDRDRLSR